MVAHQNLSILQIGRRVADQFEVAGAGGALGPVVQKYLMIEGHIDWLALKKLPHKGESKRL